MNTNYQQQRTEILQNRFGLRVAARLTVGAAGLPHDIGERLRVARQQALAERLQPKAVAGLHTAAASGAPGPAVSLGFGDEALGWWGRLASIAMVLALVVGLVAINVAQDDDRTTELADLDSALLTDDLPLEAYADPGFLRYLKAGTRDSPSMR